MRPTPTEKFAGDFDDAVIHIAEAAGSGKPRPKDGLLMVVDELRRSKPESYASYLRAAYVNRRARQDAANPNGACVVIQFASAPSGCCVSEDGRRIISAAEARSEKPGMPIPEHDQPPQPVLVVSNDFDGPADDEGGDEPA